MIYFFIEVKVNVPTMIFILFFVPSLAFKLIRLNVLSFEKSPVYLPSVIRSVFSITILFNNALVFLVACIIHFLVTTGFYCT